MRLLNHARRPGQPLGPGTWSRPSVMPMDAYRDGDQYVIAFDLPGIDPDVLDIDVERNMLTVRAERRPLARSESAQTELSERPLGVFSRQVVLADRLDTERIAADYETGVLTLRIPIAERARPRKISVRNTGERKELVG
ncbi:MULTISPECIES: Hsp20/alpha crystallin family protein [Streptomyces]|uniref:Hsp20/alpha crystallin family protein n=1 Tax=Streptomyces mirabilis TaxID=68239 RepID=A0ABU3V7S1_9ACTN|nr:MULTISPECIES: Hsp20/alpha crystallin family protein [Streptomyces]MCX4419406.1 Hsp20/alpha crystallin family protein [Streptomyces mirabilis]MCX4617576.1 Hsp20/alpha crystallin family protein [Streptomyces mirabilis]MCX5356949.1 Hsp20/alpha crystallin family protein [Streptomyces mirabilis]MDU9002065.1 Hsp20/alpha crystallin family protein [Streptomyces mirabilis]QDO05180.1 Hsp20/alpha crystallin family protein [Streptomyces sp. S1D4-23]